jgi:hypothetical protein
MKQPRPLGRGPPLTCAVCGSDRIIAAVPGTEAEYAPGGILLRAGVSLSCWCLEHWTALLDRNLPKPRRGGINAC